MPRTKPPKASSSPLDAAVSALLPPIKARHRKKEGLSAVARALAEARVTAGMTQAELARDAGVSLNSLRKIEQGDMRVNLVTVMKIVSYLDSELTIVPRRRGSQETNRG